MVPVVFRMMLACRIWTKVNPPSSVTPNALEGAVRYPGSTETNVSRLRCRYDAPGDTPVCSITLPTLTSVASRKRRTSNAAPLDTATPVSGPVSHVEPYEQNLSVDV